MNRKSQPLHIYMAAPRGFCAGVERAVQIVEQALKKYGAPVYVRHEIVHNAHVVKSLKAKGAIFVQEISECDPQRPVIFSAHGVAKTVPKEAQSLNIHYIDATCPLVSKVHYEAHRLHQKNYDILLIGHAGHPEVVGTMGQLPEGCITLIETLKDAESFLPVASDKPLAYITQTTLSVDDTRAIISILKKRFPNILSPHKEDICYATTNRQAAVKQLAKKAGLIYVIGAENSSNSQRLVEVALRAGAEQAFLIRNHHDINWKEVQKNRKIGLTASASAPEILVDEVLTEAQKRFALTVESLSVTKENITFKLPKEVSI